MSRIIWRSHKMPSELLSDMERKVDTQTAKLAKRLGDTFFDAVIPITPVDTGNMKKSWVKEYNLSGPNKSAQVYNTATNERTGYPYPIALNYGYRHFYYGNFVGFKAGLYFREQAEGEVLRKGDAFLDDVIRSVLRSW